MATQTLTYRPVLSHATWVNAILPKCSQFIKSHLPRRGVVLSVGLLLFGLGIPVLMLLELIPVTLLIGFFGFALITAGGLLTLFNI